MSLLDSYDADKCVILQLGSIWHSIMLQLVEKGKTEGDRQGESYRERERMPQGLAFNLPTNPNQCHYFFPLHFISS